MHDVRVMILFKNREFDLSDLIHLRSKKKFIIIDEIINY